MKKKPDQTNLTRVQAAISELQIVADDLAGEFTVEHLIVAEPWDDRFECLKWAVESQATVKEMIAWHRAQNGLDLFAPVEIPEADQSDRLHSLLPTETTATAEQHCKCGKPLHRTTVGEWTTCFDCQPF